MFDILLTRDLSRAHVVDFNPYAPHTDPLLFTYEELNGILTDGSERLPVFKVVDSRAHPGASRNAPVHQHNMVPLEVLALSAGRTVTDFADVLEEEIKRSQVYESDII